jgi:hypothetical protein
MKGIYIARMKTGKGRIIANLKGIEINDEMMKRVILCVIA